MSLPSAWFTQELQDDLNSVGTKQSAPAGQTFIDTENEDCYTYVILQGKVRVWASNDPYAPNLTQPVLLDDIEAIDIVGEISAIDGEPYSSLVETLTDTEFVKVSSAQFSELMIKHRDLERHVMQGLCRKIRNINDRLRDAQIFSANERVTREIIRLGQQNEQDNKGVITDFPRHHILAARCGVTRETVSRAVGQLIKKGLLKRDGRAMVIHDVEALACGFDKPSGET